MCWIKGYLDCGEKAAWGCFSGKCTFFWTELQTLSPNWPTNLSPLNFVQTIFVRKMRIKKGAGGRILSKNFRELKNRPPTINLNLFSIKRTYQLSLL
jgi:hypothetical protein